MNLLRASLGIACAAFALTSEAGAQQRVIQTRNADRELFLVSGPDGAQVRDGDQRLQVALPTGAELSAIEPLGDGWIVAGTASDGERIELVLLVESGGEVTSLPAPPGVAGPSLARPCLLVERGAFVGLAWLEGAGYDSHAVRAAVWNGDSWDAPETVSPADLDSQLALSCAVLSDGGWLLVWSAVDGHDDEIFWARRQVHGPWSRRRQLNPGNTTPDIQPSVATGPAGTFVAWNWLDGSDYRVRLARLEGARWRDPGFIGPRGSVSPQLISGTTGPLLLYRAVLPSLWAVLELGDRGWPWRWASAETPTPGAPALSVGEEVVFVWPVPAEVAPTDWSPWGARSNESDDLEIVAPWQPWQLESTALEPTEVQPRAPELAPEAGAVLYRAFGDSITLATGWPAFPSNPLRYWFDIEDEPDCSTFPVQECPIIGPACDINADPYQIRCGYNWRLEDQLDAVFPSDVANDGWGGEGTPAGVTRIDSVLDDGGDVLLLMEGTNDINVGWSVASIKANIETMTDKATARGFDTAIASVIKRRVPMCPPPCLPPTEDLRNELQSLAVTKNRAFVDAWSALDPATNNDYWDPPECCGHSDASGYDKIEPFFRNAILADPILAAPNPLTPAGDVDATPTFSWDEETGARLYRLSITGPGAPADSWHDSLAICAASVCSLSLAPLLAGSHTWKVAGKNLRGLGPFTADQTFEVFTAPPGVPSLIGPIDETFDETPRYRWTDVPQAADYELEVTGTGGFPPREYSASTICDGSVCEIEPADVLAVGAHTWRVRGKNNIVGPGSYTAFQPFEILDCGLFDDDVFLDDTNSGSQTYRACPGSVTSLAGFVVATGETVTLHGAASVVFEAIEVQSGATLTVRTD